LNILTEAVTHKYLGLPPLIGVDIADCFLHLIERVIARLAGYKEKFLSYGSKKVLLKVMIQVMPAYFIFKLFKVER
jgi:hypothetical protein